MDKTIIIANDGEYRQYVRDRINELIPVLARSAVGDYNCSVPIGEEDDEFGELYAGIQFMLEALQEMITKLERLEAKTRRQEP